MISYMVNWEPLQPLKEEITLSDQPKRGQLTQEGAGRWSEVMQVPSPPASELVYMLSRQVVKFSKQHRDTGVT